MQCSTPGTTPMDSASDSETGQSLPNPYNTHQGATTPGATREATLQSQNMPKISPEELCLLDQILHAQGCKDVLQELENSDHVDAMDTSQLMSITAMNTPDVKLNTPVLSVDEQALSDRSDSGYGQSEVERRQEDHPSVSSDADSLIRSSEPQASIRAICPSSSSLQGGIDFALIFNECLPLEIESAFAFFGSVRVEVNSINAVTLMGKVPASDKPGIVTVKVQSKDGMFLGNILFQYIDAEETLLKKMVNDPKLLEKFYKQMAEKEGKKARESLKQPNLQPPYVMATEGSSPASHVLVTLVYTAAKYDALEPIKMIFESSNGSAVFHAYKDRAKLPESVARDHGNDDTAIYLEEVTTRFYEEIKSGKEVNHTVDWLELLNAAKEGQRRRNHDAEERDIHHLELELIKESGYSADIESSDSERYTPIPFEAVQTTLAEDSTVMVSADKDSDIMPPIKEKNSVFSSAAIKSGRSPSPEKESGVTPSFTKERDITPLAVTERNITPLAKRDDFTRLAITGRNNTPLAERKSDFTPLAVTERNITQLAERESDFTPSAVIGDYATPSNACDGGVKLSSSTESDVMSSTEEGSHDKPSAGNDIDIALTATKESNITPSTERERSVTPSAAEENNVMSSSHEKSVVTLSVAKEADLEPSAAEVRDFKPLTAEGTVESDTITKQIEDLKEKLTKEQRMSVLRCEQIECLEEEIKEELRTSALRCEAFIKEIKRQLRMSASWHKKIKEQQRSLALRHGASKEEIAEQQRLSALNCVRLEKIEEDIEEQLRMSALWHELLENIEEEIKKQQRMSALCHSLKGDTNATVLLRRTIDDTHIADGLPLDDWSEISQGV